MNNLPLAENMNYWKTGRTAPDDKIDQVCKMIEDAEGKVLARIIGMQAGKEAILIEFELAGEHCRICWPVLPTETGNARAAKIQAATFIYHDVKARCMSAQVLGVRNAFMPYVVVGGQPLMMYSTPELVDQMPKLLTSEM